MGELGRLEAVDPRTVWRSEAADFTPWLKEHPEHLAEVVGIGIELTVSEHAVGGFSLDILGRDLAHNSVLIVENQLAGTDHDHLGKLLTYAAGTDAATIVWIATDIREEHRQAIDWLNEHTDEDVRFFAIRLQIMRIGDSPPAPRLDVVAQPNDWQRQVRVATRASTTANEAQLLSAVGDLGYRAALETLLNDCRRFGLSLEWGSVGTSIRLRSPDRGQPLSIGWLFPPDRVGWMGLRNLNLGVDPNSLEGHPSLRQAVEEYLTAVAEIPGMERVQPTWLEAYEIPPDVVTRALDRVRLLLERLVEGAQTGGASPGGAGS